MDPDLLDLVRRWHVAKAEHFEVVAKFILSGRFPAKEELMTVTKRARDLELELHRVIEPGYEMPPANSLFS